MEEGHAGTPSERLTAQFYDWEMRGRGWQVWPEPVRLEPPFRRFVPAGIAGPEPVADDGRRHTIFSAVIDRIDGWLKGRRVPPVESPPEVPEDEPEATETVELDDLVETQVTIPPGLAIGRDATEQFVQSLSYAAHPIGFEVIGDAQSIAVQLACHETDVDLVRRHLAAFFPDAVMSEKRHALERRWVARGSADQAIVDFGLSQEFVRPLRTFSRFDVDPLIAVAAALSGLKEDEVGVLQVLFQACHAPWAEASIQAVTGFGEGAFFADAPEMVPLMREKVAKPLVAAVVRAAARSPRRGRALGIARTLGGALRQFSRPPSNELIPLTNDGYDNLHHEEDLLRRRSRRCGMILNSEELVSLVHLPAPSVRAEKLVRETRKTKAAPELALGHRLVLGENTHAGKTVDVSLAPAQRIRHTYVIGASGTGKSTLLLNMLVQDIENGEGVGVLDPHGDLVDEILGRVPEKRLEDVVLLDPSDKEYAVGLNILRAHSDLEKQLLASDLVAVFRRLSTSWGDQMTSVMANAVLAVLESTEGGTLADLRRFLVEPAFRRRFLETVQDAEVVYYWQKEFPLLARKPQAPLLTRLDTFLRPKLIRHMVSQKENRLDFAAIMNGRKVFLAKLAQGAIGEENAYLLGALLVSKLHQIAQSRQEVAESERPDFYLYTDEFHNFLTPSMAAILAGARKYHLGLVLAHQDLGQLARHETGILGAAIANPATRVCFRVGDMDARRLEEGFSFFEAKDLQSLSVGEAICRIDQAQHDFNLRTRPLPPVDAALARSRRERIVELSREKFALPRQAVEAALVREPPEPEAEPEAEVTEAPTASDASEAAGKATPAEVPPSARPAPPKKPVPAPRPAPGRGGPEHKRLQHFLKLLGESRGYRATIEKSLPGGGRVDVAIEKGDVTIACEVCVTTNTEHELANIRKCIAAGFKHVAVVFERSNRTRIKKLIADNLTAEEQARVSLLTRDEVLPFLDARDADAAGAEGTVRGIKVKTTYRPPPEEEVKAREKGVADAIQKAARRKKEDPDAE